MPRRTGQGARAIGTKHYKTKHYKTDSLDRQAGKRRVHHRPRNHDSVRPEGRDQIGAVPLRRSCASAIVEVTLNVPAGDGRMTVFNHKPAARQVFGRRMRAGVAYQATSNAKPLTDPGSSFPGEDGSRWLFESGCQRAEKATLWCLESVGTASSRTRYQMREKSDLGDNCWIEPSWGTHGSAFAGTTAWARFDTGLEMTTSSVWSASHDAE